jgi:hypothetical protein
MICGMMPVVYERNTLNVTSNNLNDLRLALQDPGGLGCLGCLRAACTG